MSGLTKKEERLWLMIKTNPLMDKYNRNKSNARRRLVSARFARYKLENWEVADMIVRQNGCAICHCGLVEKDADVDHNHATGEVRGILCKPCNKGLGNFKDDPVRLKAAIAYLGAASSRTFC